jgi:hypothetical protein
MLPTDRWTRALFAPALVFIAAGIDRNYQTDLWHHLARGRVIAAEGRLLDEDRFTYTVAGRPFQDANWLWQVSHYGLYTLGGLPLVQTVNAAVLAAAMAVLVMHCRRRSGSLSAAAIVCIIAFLGLWQFFLIRPQTFSFLFFVVLHAMLEAARKRPRLLWLVPLLMALWANVHGGFPVGLALIGCYAAAACFSERRAGGVNPLEKQGVHTPRSPRLPQSLRTAAPWALCLLAAVAETFINPYGWNVYRYVLHTSRTASGRGIDEWLPPGLDILAGKMWVLSILGLLVLLARTGRRRTERRPRVVDLLLIACFLPAACGSVRMVAWWLLVSAPLLTTLLADAWPRLKQLDAATARPTAAAGLIVGVFVMAMVFSVPWLERCNPVFARPGRAHRTETDLQSVADRLASVAPGGRVFTRFEWGEYIGWALAGRWKVFMDGRIEIFPDEVWAQYSAVTRGRADWEQLLDAHDVRWLLLDTGYHRDLLPVVEGPGRWQVVFRQGDAVLLARRGTDLASAQ